MKKLLDKENILLFVAMCVSIRLADARGVDPVMWLWGLLKIAGILAILYFCLRMYYGTKVKADPTLPLRYRRALSDILKDR